MDCQTIPGFLVYFQQGRIAKNSTSVEANCPSSRASEHLSWEAAPAASFSAENNQLDLSSMPTDLGQGQEEENQNASTASMDYLLAGIGARLEDTAFAYSTELDDSDLESDPASK